MVLSNMDQRGQKVEKQTNVAGDQYAAGCDTVHIEGDLVINPPSADGGQTRLVVLVMGIGVLVAGIVMAVIGAYLVYLGSTGSSEFNFFGQQFRSSNVGVAAIFIGAAMIVVVLFRLLKSFERAISGRKDTGNEPRPPWSNLRQIGDPVGDFVGREGEIKKLVAAFGGAARGAVISGVRGMGGVGKTELAKAVAKRIKKRFPDGQIMFNLRGARDDASIEPATAAEALAHVIRAFHPEARLPEEVGALQGLYHSVLEGKRVLVLMDNALDAAQLGPLVPPPDGCGLLVTSRHRFVLAGMGMEDIDLDTLRADEARKLLLGICPRIGKDADALAQRCAYLPLALRLAASALKRNPMLEVEGYSEDLGNEKLRLATLDAYKGSTDEERGVEASLGISYRLLEERLQRYWRGLGVFPGDFDAPAAGSVWQVEEKDAEKGLGDLYAASMVLWDEATRRYRLHDLARDYARARLSKAEQAAAAQRHAAHYAGVLRRAKELYKEGGDAMLQGLALFDREWGNIRAGQAWAAAHWDADETAGKLCSDYPDVGAYCLALRLHPRDWIAWLDAAVAAARKLGDRAAEGNHLGTLGLAYADLGERRKAIEFYEQHLAIARQVGDRRGEGAALGNLGLAYADLGEPRKAIDYYEQQLAITREIGDRRGEGNALGNLGNAYAALGEPRKAIEYYEQQLGITRQIGDRRGEGNALHNLARALAETGRRDEAIAHAEQAVKIYEEIESPHAAKARAQLERLRK